MSRVLKRRTQLPEDSERAMTLRMSPTIESAYVAEWHKLVEQMYAETVPAVLGEFRETAMANDAKETFWERLQRRLMTIFERNAEALATGMLNRVDRNATNMLERSLKSTSADMTLKMKNTKATQHVIDERIKDSVNLITRIPAEFLEGVREDVNKSLESGKGLSTLEADMEKRYGQARRHAKNVALDQTRKAYTAINTAKMKQNGIRKFEWVHTGGSQEPRPHHKNNPANGGLNGGIYDIDNPPIMDPKTGARGLPGQDYNCRCTMRPIVTFDEDGE